MFHASKKLKIYYSTVKNSCCQLRSVPRYYLYDCYISYHHFASFEINFCLETTKLKTEKGESLVVLCPYKQQYWYVYNKIVPTTLLSLLCINFYILLLFKATNCVVILVNVNMQGNYFIKFKYSFEQIFTCYKSYSL